MSKQTIKNSRKTYINTVIFKDHGFIWRAQKFYDETPKHDLKQTQSASRNALLTKAIYIFGLQGQAE